MFKLFSYTIWILLTSLLPLSSCFAMELPKSGNLAQRFATLSPKSKTALALIQGAHDRNDTKLFKSLVTSKIQFEEVERLWPFILKLATRHLPCDYEVPINNPKFAQILATFNCSHESILHSAARKNQIETLKQFTSPQNVNLTNLNAETPLFTAVHADYLEATEFLIKAGAHVSAETHTGTRPLHTAFKLPICKLLCENGARADINHRDIFSQTPLFYVIGQGYADVAQYLIDQGADPNVKNMLGETLLQGCCFTEFLKPNIGLSLCKKLIQAGAFVNAQSNDNRTALHIAIENRLPEHAQLLINHGADVHIPDYWNETPAMLIESAWNMPANEFIQLCAQPDFKERIIAHSTKLAKKSFEIELAPHRNQIVRAKKSPKSKNRPTFNQRKEKKDQALSPTKTENVNPLAVISKPKVIKPSFILDQRILDWQNNEWVAKEEHMAVQKGNYEYWDFIRKRLYHRVPLETLETIFRSGKKTLRPHKTYTGHLDTQYTLEGEMQFKYNDNPWQPGKRCQRGFFHMTQGKDGLIYHIGFKPISVKTKNVGDFLNPVPVEWIDQETPFYKATYDADEGIRHVLYL